MHTNKKARRGRALVLGLVAAGLLVFGVSAQAQTPVDDIVACIVGSMDSYSGCLGANAWFGDIMCTLKYDADFYLCFLAGVPH